MLACDDERCCELKTVPTDSIADNQQRRMPSSAGGKGRVDKEVSRTLRTASPCNVGTLVWAAQVHADALVVQTVAASGLQRCFLEAPNLGVTLRDLSGLCAQTQAAADVTTLLLT